MMRYRQILIGIGIVCVALMGCSATVSRRSFKESMRDSVIKTAVRYKLSKDKYVKARTMEIDVWRGVVALHGRALSDGERVRAEELARQVKHVVAVENSLKVVGAPTTSTVATTVAPATNAADVSGQPVRPVITTPSVGAISPQPASAPRPIIAKPTPPSVPPPAAAIAPKPVTKTPKATLASVQTTQTNAAAPKMTAPPPPPVAATAPAPMARPRQGGKTLPWLGEFPDEEGPSMQPVKEIAERSTTMRAPTAATPKPMPNPAAVSADEDLAREAAEELKRLKGTTGQ